MSHKYEHLLSPLVINNNFIIRNRMHATPSRPHFAMGPEEWPNEALLTHYGNKAKNGAAIVTVSCGATPGKALHLTGLCKETMNGHSWRLNIFDSQVQNHMSALAEHIHFYGSKASMLIAPTVLQEFDVDDNVPIEIPAGDKGGAGFPTPTEGRMSVSQMRKVADNVAEQACILQDCGFDMVNLHACYRLLLLARFLSPKTNTRDDEFGGSVENRARFPLMVCQRIKERCGRDFPIEFSMTGWDPTPGFEWTLDDTVAFAKLAEGRIDLLQLRCNHVDYHASPNFVTEPVPYMFMTEAVKKSGAKVLTVGINGYHDPDISEKALADGKVDIIGMARAWISNPDYGKSIVEERRQDIVPCLRCNKCHITSFADPWIAGCSVNPKFGLEHRVDHLVKPSVKPLNVAIAGGGPGGMRAALFAAERGHRVDLYEKTDRLGGALLINDFPDFKWTLRRYKDWLIKKVMDEPSISVLLNTEANCESLHDEKKYDRILAAIGADPIVPNIPGIDGKNVVLASKVFGNPDIVGERVVVVGGGHIGMETAIYLARNGKTVTVIEMKDELAADAPPIHYRSMFVDAWEAEVNIRTYTGLMCVEIRDDAVIAQEVRPKERGIFTFDYNRKTFPCSTVVIAAGMKARTQQAMQLYAPGEQKALIGDCLKAASVYHTNRSAFAVASQL